MSEITPTTRLEAVNTMLRGIGEAPVAQLQAGAGVDAPNAIATLDGTLREFMSKGWTFNTEDDYPLPRNTSNEIVVPSNALSVTFAKAIDIYPVVRGTKVYDRKNHTYAFDRSLTAKIIFGLAFEELPELARTYVTVKATRKFQNDNIGDAGQLRLTEADEARVWAAFFNAEIEAADPNMLRDTPDFYRVRSL